MGFSFVRNDRRNTFWNNFYFCSRLGSINSVKLHPNGIWIFIGYFLITKILLPIYYTFNVTSIYEYLNKRFGKISQLTSSSLFIFSRSITTSLRLFLVLKNCIFGFLNNSKIPFEATSGIIIFGIWLYTKKNGIKTIIYTDVIQTFFMLLSLFVALIILISTLDLSLGNFANWWYTNKYKKYFSLTILIHQITF